MAERVFCIDFGSSYTKVALRRDPGATAEVIRSPFRAVGEVEFCFPSVVGVERRGTKNVPLFGHQAMACRPGPGRHLHTNWKRRVFSSVEPGQAPRKAPLDAFLESPELAELAVRFGVSSAQVVNLQNLIANARALAGGPGTAPVSPAAEDRATAGPIASHYFTWLHGQVMEACHRLHLDGLDPTAIPARLTVPAFARGKELETHPGCQLLLHALVRAGWKMHPNRPIVSEPYSNAIGVLTNGTNVVNKSRANLGKMFGKGPLILTLADKSHYPSYRALLIDVGAFTTDFATVTLKTEGNTIDDPDVAFTIRQHSASVGISDLDARVFEALPKEKREWLTKTAEPVQIEAFHQQVYTDAKPYKTVEVGAIGGAADADAVRAGADTFLQHLTAETMKFCDALEPIKHQELILTGGGTAIPRVREALLKAAQDGGRTYIRFHARGLKKGGAPGHTYNLTEEATRGGSAIGGASLYFENEYN